jgi:hypothetical protein
MCKSLDRLEDSCKSLDRSKASCKSLDRSDGSCESLDWSEESCKSLGTSKEPCPPRAPRLSTYEICRRRSWMPVWALRVRAVGSVWLLEEGSEEEEDPEEG